MSQAYPRRIVCLTEETTEWLYALGEADRIVGISAYTVRPPQARAEKPVVSAFIGGHVGKIKALAPDLVIGFSDVQATLARDLIAANLPVLITNQRSVEDILGVLGMLGRIVGAEARAQALIDGYRRRIDALRASQEGLRRPKVYFEEWDEPMISAIQWVSELIEIAGGSNIFADRAEGKSSQERSVQPEEVINRAPELMIGCWCGKPLDRSAVLARPGFAGLPALRHNQLHEMDPAIILQPGPACLTDGLDALVRLMEEVR
ncbi:MAG: cobalamin-binding protein [Bacteroidetes bacterium]|nr:MAG: cobalamin-binding protein [Bacteroidota bacterium]